jgi:hypothetical protein
MEIDNICIHEVMRITGSSEKWAIKFCYYFENSFIFGESAFEDNEILEIFDYTQTKKKSIKTAVEKLQGIILTY